LRKGFAQYVEAQPILEDYF